MSVRGIHTDVTDMREKIFTEVARLAYEGGDYSRLEELPYKIVPGELASFRESVFTERAIVGERLRLAIGLPNRTLAEHAPNLPATNVWTIRQLSPICAKAVLHIRVKRYARKELLL